MERQQLDTNKTGQIQLCSTFVQSSTPEQTLPQVCRPSVKLPSIVPEHIKYLFCEQHKGNKYSTPSMEATLAWIEQKPHFYICIFSEPLNARNILQLPTSMFHLQQLQNVFSTSLIQRIDSQCWTVVWCSLVRQTFFFVQSFLNPNQLLFFKSYERGVSFFQGALSESSYFSSSLLFHWTGLNVRVTTLLKNLSTVYLVSSEWSESSGIFFMAQVMVTDLKSLRLFVSFVSSWRIKWIPLTETRPLMDY